LKKKNGFPVFSSLVPSQRSLSHPHKLYAYIGIYTGMVSYI